MSGDRLPKRALQYRRSGGRYVGRPALTAMGTGMGLQICYLKRRTRKRRIDIQIENAIDTYENTNFLFWLTSDYDMQPMHSTDDV